MPIHNLLADMLNVFALTLESLLSRILLRDNLRDLPDCACFRFEPNFPQKSPYRLLSYRARDVWLLLCG